MKHLLSFFIVAFVCLLPFKASGQVADAAAADSVAAEYVLLPDSSNFVYVSMLVSTPGVEGYSALGHCALRLQCPMHKLDYCFTFETRGDTPWFNYLSFLTGNTLAAFQPRSTDNYLKLFQTQGRGVTEYPLNLTLHEKQGLWQYLDKDWGQDNMRRFDFVRNNCTSMCLIAIDDVMWKVEGEKMNVDKWPEQMYLDNGKGIMYLTRNSPWLQYGLMALVGAEDKDFWPQMQRMSPELAGEVLLGTSIMGADGIRRPMVDGEPVELLKQVYQPTKTVITPTVVFLVVLVLVLIVTLLQYFVNLKVLPRMIDVVLLVMQTLAGCFLIYASFISCILGLHFNWLLLVFNPIPLLLWVLFRGRPWFVIVYRLYTVYLVLVIVVGPFVSSQFYLPNLLIAATLAVRTAYHGWLRALSD